MIPRLAVVLAFLGLNVALAQATRAESPTQYDEPMPIVSIVEEVPTK